MYSNNFSAENYEENQIKQSKLNSAGLINVRLHRLWGICDMVSAGGNYLAWNAFLDSIWRTLASDSSPEDKKTYKKFETLLLNSNFFNLYIKKPGFELPTEEEMKSRAFHYRILQEKHIFLKMVENKQGKGTAYIDEFEDDFE